MKRIAIVIFSFPKLSESFIVSKFLSLLDEGWDVHFVCVRSDPREWRRFPDLTRRPELRHRVHVTWPSSPRWLVALLMTFSLAWCALRTPRALSDYLRRGVKRFETGILRKLYMDAEMVALDADLIHFEFGTIAAERMRLKELLNSKLVVSFRGYDITYAGLEDPSYYAEVWERSDALHLLGGALWREAQRRGCPPEKLHALIPPAVDLGFFDPGDRQQARRGGGDDRPFRILSVGRLNWAKGYEYGLAAPRILRDRGVIFECGIIGSGDFLEAIAFARRQMGLDGVVHLWGPQPRDEVKARMLWADTMLHSAISEGFCCAVVEAQAMALPIVCTDSQGLQENVANGETGFVVPRRDPVALADKLELLARDADLRRRMGEAGRRRALAEYQLNDKAKAFSRLYSTVLGESHSEALH